MRRLALTLIGLTALIDLSCSDASGPGNQSNGRISITNNAGVLASRVTYLNDAIPIDSAGVGYPSAGVPLASATVSRSTAASQVTFNLLLKAEVAPPAIGGQRIKTSQGSTVCHHELCTYSMV